MSRQYSLRSTPTKGPSRSAGKPPKSPTVANPSAVSALLLPRSDFQRIATSAQTLGKKFDRGGNENWKASSSRSIRVNDLVAVPNADFSMAKHRHRFTEELLFRSYFVYFYVVKDINLRMMTLQYAGRIEPYDPHPPAEFATSLLLEQLPRDSITLPLDSDGKWVITTSKGHDIIQALFPTLIDDGNGNGKNSGSGGGSSSSRGGGGRSSSSNSSSKSTSGGSSRSSSNSLGSNSHGGGSRRSSSTGGGAHTSGNSLVTFSDNEHIITAAGVGGVAELPFLGSSIPPMTAANDTIFWRPLGAGRAVSSNISGSTTHQPLICSQTSTEFPLINVNRQDTKESTTTDEKMEDSALARRLVNPHHVSTHFTGKGLEIKPLEDVRRFFENQSISVRNDRDTHGPLVSNGWNQTNFDVGLFNQISSCKVYQSPSLYARYYKFGLFKSTGNPSELDSSSPRLADFIAASLSFDPELKVTSDNDNLGQKAILATAIHQVELTLCLSRHPAVFLDSFAPIVTALSDPTHEVGKDLYTVAALTWQFEMSLAEFFRRIRYHKGLSDVLVFRKLLWTIVVSPFVNLTPQVPIAYSLAHQTRQLQKMVAAQRKEASALMTPPSNQPQTSTLRDTPSSNVSTVIANISSVKNSVPMNKKVCKYHFASYLKVPFPGAENKIPECMFKDDPMNCPACPHQDFNTWAKKDLKQLLSQVKQDFNSSPAWLSIYTGMVAAIEKLE